MSETAQPHIEPFRSSTEPREAQLNKRTALSVDRTRYHTYHPKTALALGKGYEERDLVDPKRSFLNFEPIPLDSGSPSAEVELIYVRTYEGLLESSKVDIDVEASYLGFSGSAGYLLDKEAKFSKSSVVVILRASADYGRWGVPANATMSEDAKNLLEDSQAFAERYGDRFVEIDQRGATISVLLQLDSVDESEKQRLETEVSAGGSWGVLSASGSAKFEKVMQQAAARDNLRIEARSTGGEGLSTLSATLKAAARKRDDALSSMKDAMAETLATFDKSNASTIKYSTVPMERWGWSRVGKFPWSKRKFDAMRRLSRSHDIANRELDILRDFRKGSGLYFHLAGDDFIRTENRDEIPAQIIALESYIERIENAHRALKNDKSFDPADADITPVSFVREVWREKSFSLDVGHSINGLNDDGTHYQIDDPSQASYVLSVAPEKRLKAIRTIVPTAKPAFKISLTIGGYALRTIQNKFVLNGKALVGERYPMPFNEAGYGFHWYDYDSSDQSDGMIASDTVWLGNNLAKGTSKISKSLIFQDRLERTHEITIYTAEVDIDSRGKISYIRFEHI